MEKLAQPAQFAAHRANTLAAARQRLEKYELLADDLVADIPGAKLSLAKQEEVDECCEAYSTTLDSAMLYLKAWSKGPRVKKEPGAVIKKEPVDAAGATHSGEKAAPPPSAEAPAGGGAAAAAPEAVDGAEAKPEAEAEVAKEKAEAEVAKAEAESLQSVFVSQSMVLKPVADAAGVLDKAALGSMVEGVGGFTSVQQVEDFQAKWKTLCSTLDQFFKSLRQTV
eukprot:3092620-Alexandrium_andersonii.AAC.1